MADPKLIEIKPTPDLAETAVREVARALAHPARFPHLDKFDEMRQRAADNIVSLAFRRYITQENIPHKAVKSDNFTEPGQYDISFSGRRCLTFAQMVCRREVIGRVHQQPANLLQGEVYIQEGGATAATRDIDLYLFIYLTALVARSRDETEQARLAGQPVYLLHQMPESWSLPKKRGSMGRLALKSDTSEPIWLELHGQDELQGYRSVSISLPPRQRVVEQTALYSLGAARTASMPSGRVGMHSPAMDDTMIISPHQWGNIWVYPMRIYLAGYITQADFNRQAQRVIPEQFDPVNPCLQVDSMMRLPVAALRPVDDLFVRVRNWARQQDGP
jgi:hypothetical protein